MTSSVLTRDGMPSHEGDLSVEGHGFEPIPESARYGSASRVFTVWFAPNLVPAAFFIGTLVTLNFLKLGFVTALLAIIVGNIVGSVLVGVLATMGPRTGMAQMPLARLAYGKSIIVPGILNWISCIGWDGINSLFGAYAVTILIPAVPFWLALLVIVIAQGALGVLGYEAIHQFERYASVALAVMFVVLTAWPDSTRWARSSRTSQSWRASCSRGRCMRRTTRATCPATPRHRESFCGLSLASRSRPAGLKSWVFSSPRRRLAASRHKRSSTSSTAAFLGRWRWSPFLVGPSP